MRRRKTSKSRKRSIRRRRSTRRVRVPPIPGMSSKRQAFLVAVVELLLTIATVVWMHYYRTKEEKPEFLKKKMPQEEIEKLKKAGVLVHEVPQKMTPAGD